MVDHNVSKAASALLVMAMTEMVWLGGREAAVEVLEAMAARVRAGEFPEPQHPAGHA